MMTRKEFARLKRGDVVEFTTPSGLKYCRIVILGPKDESPKDLQDRCYVRFAKMVRGQFFDAWHGMGVTTLYQYTDIYKRSRPIRLGRDAYLALVRLERQRLRELGCKSISMAFAAARKELDRCWKIHGAVRPSCGSRSFWK